MARIPVKKSMFESRLCKLSLLNLWNKHSFKHIFNLFMIPFMVKLN